jgi:hypothetical protein
MTENGYIWPKIEWGFIFMELKIVSNGKYTIALLYDYKGGVKRTFSSCHPDDTFSLFEGVRLCINRMTNYKFGKVKYVDMEPNPETPMRDLIARSYPDSCVNIRMRLTKYGLFKCEVRRVEDLHTDKLELDMTGGRWLWGDMREEYFLKKCRDCMKEITERYGVKI